MNYQSINLIKDNWRFCCDRPLTALKCSEHKRWLFGRTKFTEIISNFRVLNQYMLYIAPVDKITVHAVLFQCSIFNILHLYSIYYRILH